MALQICDRLRDESLKLLDHLIALNLLVSVNLLHINEAYFLVFFEYLGRRLFKQSLKLCCQLGPRILYKCLKFKRLDEEGVLGKLTHKVVQML